jgi:hypothetical protein
VTVRVKVDEDVPPGPTAVNVYDFEVWTLVGIPEIVPELEFKIIPDGSAGETE